MNGLVLDGPRINTMQPQVVSGENNVDKAQHNCGVNANDAAQCYEPLSLDSDVVKSAETLAFDLTASANSATKMAQLFLQLVQSLREAAENRAEVIIQQMETQVEVKRDNAETIASEAKDAKDKGDEAVHQQRIAAAINIGGAVCGGLAGAGATKFAGAQAGAAVSSLVTTGSGGSAGFASAEAANQNNKVTEIQEKSKAEQAENDATAQEAAALQQRAQNWEGTLNDIQAALLSLAKEFFSQEPSTARNMGNNI